MSKCFAALMIVSLFALSTSAAQAALIVDDPVEPNDGWVVAGSWNSGFGLTTPIEGPNLANMAGGGAEPKSKSFTGVLLGAGTYTTTFWVHNYSNNGNPPPGLNSHLQANAVDIDDLLTSSTTPIPTPGNWAQWTLVHDVLAGDTRIGQTIGFRITDIAGGGNGAFDSLDIDFAAAAAIPEPSAFVLTALGLVGLVFGRRRKRN